MVGPTGLLGAVGSLFQVAWRAHGGDLTNSLTLALLTGLCDPIFLLLPIRKQGL